MHPILFKLPGVDWPVRLFGLFVLDAFFLATLWAQWQMVRLKDPTIRDNEALTRRFRLVLIGTVISRVLFLLLPIPWVATLVAILVTDFGLYFFVRAALNKALRGRVEVQVSLPGAIAHVRVCRVRHHLSETRARSSLAHSTPA